MSTDDEDSDRGWLLNIETDPKTVAKRYDDWANQYDEELREWDYRSPDEASRLLAAHAPDAAKVLDAGCGTGLSGLALAAAGFGDLVGIDISEESLAIAARRKVYSELHRANLHERPLDFPANSFDALICVGVLTYVPDTADAMREFCRIVRPGGCVVFTCRDDIYQERDYASVIAELEREKKWRPLHQSAPSPYLPGNSDFADTISVMYVACEIS